MDKQYVSNIIKRQRGDCLLRVYLRNNSCEPGTVVLNLYQYTCAPTPNPCAPMPNPCFSSANNSFQALVDTETLYVQPFSTSFIDFRLRYSNYNESVNIRFYQLSYTTTNDNIQVNFKEF